MTSLTFHATQKPSPEYLETLRVAARKVYPEGVSLRPVTNLREAILLLDPFDNLDDMVAMFRYAESLVPWPGNDSETLYLDIESHNADLRWDMPVEEFFRLGQYAWGIGGEVRLLESFEEVVALCRQAYGIVAHNGHSFDFSVLLGDYALELARENRLFDTMVYGNLAFPAPFTFKDRDGRQHFMEMAGVPKVVPHTMKWLSLDNLAFQMNIPGKIGNLKELAKKYNPPGTPVSELDYGLIPTDDPDFLAYAVQDVKVLQGITQRLMMERKPEAYDWREQLCAAINAQISRNGWPVDAASAQERVEELAENKERILNELHEKYNFPLEGKAPWSTKVGKAAIFEALKDLAGLVPGEIEDWPKGKTGPSLSGLVLKEFCEDTPAQELAEAVATLAGQRPLATQVLDCLHTDGKVHLDITSLQRSGRMSFTKPSIGTWTARGDNSVEKRYFIADPGCVLVEFDLNNADGRCVAAMSRDYKFAKRFEEGVDAHEITGRFVFGNELYDSDPKNYRQKAKVAAHGWAYSIGAKKLSRNFKIDLKHAEAFVNYMANTYRKVVAWQNRVRADGDLGYVVNDWGRKMPIDVERAYSQSPAMLGQSSTREILFDALIKLPNEVLRMLKATVHDAVVFSFPEHRTEELSQLVKEAFEIEWNGIFFPLQKGPEAKDWFSAGH